MCICLIIRGPRLIIEFQRELNVSWRLCATNLSHVGANTHVGYVELNVVERIDEFSPELQLESLSECEIFMQAQIHIRVMRPSKTSELRQRSYRTSQATGW